MTRFLVLLVAFGTSGCFFYDSRWGEATKSQQRVAEHHMPEGLASEPGEAPVDGPGTACSTELRLRVHDASSVSASTRGHGFAEVVARANQVLAPDLGACLTLSEVRPWKQVAATASLEAQLAELEQLDGGEGVDLVVGIGAPTQLLTFSFSQLGVAEFLGKHLVLRSASDAAELEAIESAFPDLDAKARSELYAKRKLHKATVLLLHELGHTLGAIHTTQRTELMYPSYSADMNGFSESTRALLRISLESRESATERGVSSTRAARMLELLKSTPSGTWNLQDFEARLKVLETMAAAPPRTTSAKAASGLAPADQAAYDEAARLLDAKRSKEAWARAKPLFDRYLGSYEVQDLRCKIAMELGGDWETARQECEPLMRLTRASTAPEPAR